MLDQALTEAVEILNAARYPLIYGLSRSSTAGQRAAVRLADRLGGVIDTTASVCHGPSIIAVQSVGESTCSLGEVRNRSDLVIFWGCNPAVTHPRHAERYSVFPTGRFVPAGRPGRTVVLVGDAREVDSWRLDPAGSTADLVIPIDPGRDFEAIQVLRSLLKGLDITPSRSQAGAVPDDLRSLCALMRGCRSGAVFFGLGLTGTSLDGSHEPDACGHANVEGLLRLVAELNGVTRFYARRMRIHGDVSGADSVLCWTTGFPFSVNLSRGYPRYNPGEYSAGDLLERGEPDAFLCIGSETLSAFSKTALRHLRQIPTIVLDNPAAEPAFTPTVNFLTAACGLHAAGTLYRMDETPLPMRALVESELPTDDEILRRISDRVEYRAGLVSFPRL